MCMRLFRARFYDFEKNKVHLLSTVEQNRFAQAYYGGVTMVIKPTAPNGKEGRTTLRPLHRGEFRPM